MYIVCYTYDGKVTPKFKFHSKNKAYEYIYEECIKLMRCVCTCHKNYLFKILDKENKVTIFDLAKYCYCSYPFSEGYLIIDTKRINYK